MSKLWEKLFVVFASAWGILRILVARPRVIVFGTDMIGAHPYEPRMARIYAWLDSRHITYAHLTHVTSHGRVVRHWFQRRRPIVYLEGLERIGVSLSWLFRASGVRRIWGIDDYRHWRTVTAAAHQASIPCALFQHGRFTRHQSYLTFEGIPPAHIPLPDAYIVWNEYWRDKLMSISPLFRQHPDVVRVGGKPSAETVMSLGHRGASGEILRVTVVHEPAAPSGEVRAFMQRLLAMNDVAVTYKIRADQPEAAQLRHAGLADIAQSDRFHVTASLTAADVVLGSYSTLLYEMVQAGVPVGVVKMSSLQAEDLVGDGLAAFVDPRADDLRQELARAAQVPQDELERRAARLRITVPIEETLVALFS